MFEISHQQAERLIRRQSDLLLSDEEWNALQYHLEHCPDCRIDQARNQRAEQKLSQCLRARWNPVPGPCRGLPQIVAKASRERSDRRNHQATVDIYLAVFLLILLLAAGQINSQRTQEAVPDTGGSGKTPVPSPSPTQIPTIPWIQPGQFPHIIAYESQTEGNTEIYLLNPGFAPVNLTQHPAEDTFPAWSPDGEWLAFLSNRDAPDPGDPKNELYVISIAGNQQLQLTRETSLDWEGPLSWSPDGEWIAVAGVSRDAPRQRSIYIVGVDGSGPHRLRDTQGGASPKFAPYGDRLAFYQKDANLKRMVIYHIHSDLFTVEEIPQTHPDLPAADVAFDWPADGDGLYYSAAQPAQAPDCARLVFQQIPNDEAWYTKLSDHFHWVGEEMTGSLASVSWAPQALVIYAGDLMDRAGGMIHCDTGENCMDFLDLSRSQAVLPQAVALYPHLCITSGFDRGSWSLDMRWFIFSAYEQGTGEAGLYALRMPGLKLSWQLSGTESAQSAAIPAGSVFRLSTGSVKTALPRMRPFRAGLKIEPQPARPEPDTAIAQGE